MTSGIVLRHAFFSDCNICLFGDSTRRVFLVVGFEGGTVVIQVGSNVKST